MLEQRRLLADPTFGWTLDAPAAHPVAYVDATGAGFVNPNGFKAENLNAAAGSFNTPKGLDAAGRHAFGPLAGVPADGNYELTLPRTSFNPAPANGVQATSWFITGDFDRNRAVDFADFVIQAQNYDETATNKTFAQGDADGDGDVDQADIGVVTARYNRRLAPAPAYEGEVTVSSLAVQPDGTTPLVVNWAPISDRTLQQSDPDHAGRTIAGYDVSRSTDGTTFAPIGRVVRDLAAPALPTQYEFVDPTPADGTKHWYRIRPYYVATNPDGTTGEHHLPTTNKAWRVSALRGPSGVDVATAGTQALVTWRDNSASESGFVIERQLDDGSWSQVGTTSANARTFGFGTAGAAATNAVRVRAIRSDLTIDSVAAAVTPTALSGASSIRADLSDRRSIFQGSSIVYTLDLGAAHAGDEVQVSGGESGLTVGGTYTLDGLGRASVTLTATTVASGVRRLLVSNVRTTQKIIVVIEVDDAPTAASTGTTINVGDGETSGEATVTVTPEGTGATFEPDPTDPIVSNPPNPPPPVRIRDAAPWPDGDTVIEITHTGGGDGEGTVTIPVRIRGDIVGTDGSRVPTVVTIPVTIVF